MFNGLSQLKKGLSKGNIHGLNGGLMQGLNSGLNPRTRKYSSIARIVINKSKCGASDLTNFPVCVSLNDKLLANIANGGRVFDLNGYDILFFSDAGCTSPLFFELEYYNVSGILIAWVNVPKVYTGVDTVFYMKFGIPSVSTSRNSTSTWDSNYKRVLHLPNGTTLSALDSTSNADNGTITTPTAAVGQIDGGALFNSTTDYISFTGTPLTTGQPFSLSWWEKVTANTNAFPSRFCMPMSGSSDRFFVLASTNATYSPYSFGPSPSISGLVIVRPTGSPAISTNIGTWRKILITGTDPSSRTAANYKFYQDGVLYSTVAAGGVSALTINRVGYDGADNGADCTMDEIRISDGIQRSVDWELTEYNNQSSPSTFYSVQMVSN